MALRALSSGPTTAINSGRSSISSSARTAKTLNLARPITRPTFLSRPRIWVLEITLDFDQQCPARQQRPNRVAIEDLDAHLLKPAGLHLEYRLGVARVDADHRQAKLLELGPQPCGRRSCLKADPYRSRCFRSHERSDRLRLGIDYALSHD